MARTDFAAALRLHSLQVAKLEGAQAEEFLRLLKDLADTLRGRYAALGGQENPLDVSSLRQIIAETEAGIKVLEVKTGREFRGAQGDAVELSIEHIVEEVSRLSLAFDSRPSVLKIDAAKVLADPIQGLLANHFDSSVRRYGLDLLNDVRRRLFIGMRAGDSLGNIVKDIGGQRGPFGVVGKANATRLARTEMSQAYGAAHHLGLQQAEKHDPELQPTWLHIGSYLCKTCGPLHGTQRPVDGTWTIKSGKKTRKVAFPPAHPNCACRLSAMKPKWRAKLIDAGYLEKQPATNEEGAASL